VSGKQVKRFRTDGGGEYTSKKFAEYLKLEGIVNETTMPYTPQSNGVVERANREIMQRVRCMLDFAGLSKKYRVVLATGPGNPPAVRVLICDSVDFITRTGQNPEPGLAWRVVSRPGHGTVGISLGWNQTAVPNLQFLQLWLHFSM